MVRRHYPLCRTTRDRENLARELGIDSVAKLYNLASRLGATGKNGAVVKTVAMAQEEERLLQREEPGEIIFTPEADHYLRAEFGRRAASVIAFRLHHTETAVLYRARHLGLRRPVRYWDVVKVAFWLGLELHELQAMAASGLDIHPFHDPSSGRLVKEVVSTISLARWMTQPKIQRLLEERDADRFFLLEILESVKDIQSHHPNPERGEFERCKFLSGDHICMNTYAVSYGLYCTNTERQRAGEDPNCSVRTMEIDDLRPDEQGEAV